MKLLARVSLVLMSPYLVVIYWRNSLKEIGNLHAQIEFNYE